MNGKLFAGVVLLVSAACFALFAAYFERSQAPSVAPAQPPAEASLLVRPHSPVTGPQTAPVTIVEFLDPECESCRAMYPIVKSLLAEYGERVRLVIRYMPLHGNSVLAASSLEEARELGKYDEALALLLERQPEWGSHHAPRPELIPRYLASLGIDPARLEPDYVIPKHRWKIDQDQADGVSLGVRGTPVFFVNGVRLPELGYASLKQAIEIALSVAPSAAQPG
jgi:protein-disulfide isomerase